MTGRFSSADSEQRSAGSWRFCFWAILFFAALGFGPKASANTTNQIAELSWLTVTNQAPELESSGAPLTHSLIESPAGAAVSTNGVITWMPTEAQGPCISQFLAVVTDGTNSVTNSFTVIVTEENERPIAVSDSYTVSNTTLSVLSPGVLANDSDADLPANDLAAVWLSGPTNGVLNLSSNGGFIYTPNPGFSGADGFAYHVQDGLTNSAPASVALTVIQQGFRILSVTKTGGVATVTWESEAGKSYRVLSKDGVAAPTWRVLVGDVTATTATTNKTDSLENATQRFYRVQLLTNHAPELPNQELQTIPELSTLTVVNTATDADLPDELLTYALSEAPTNAAISTKGVITWTPTESQGPGTNVFTTVVTDNGGLTATNSFTVIVTETNEPPVFVGTPADLVVAEHTLVTMTNAATDVDEPAYTLIYSLIDAPAGATVDGSGVITWTPNEAQGPSTNTLTTVVSDGVASVTNSFVVVVTDVNAPPTLPATPSVTIAELEALTVTNTATDLDVPANVLTYNLVEFPAGALMDTNGLITWTPDETQGDTTNIFTTIVADDFGLSATNSFVVVVTEANVAPQLPPQPDVVIAELASLSVTNTATDADIPAQILSYQLLNPPSGAAIDANGVINWTPTEAQGPGTNVFVTVVTDGSASTTNNFTVIVTEENVAPALPTQSNLTIAEFSSLVVTNTATDSDEPANVLTYNLVGAPAGALVDTNGVITWTPNESQGSTTNVFTTVVTDSGGLSTTNHFTVTVTEVNQAPQLPTQTDFVVAEHILLTVTNAATDSDEPANGLTYILTTSPSGAVVDTNGVITWTPNEAQGPSTNAFVMVVTDDGGLSATNSFTVVVTEANSAPQLPLQTGVIVPELATLTVTNAASDSDEPANQITYLLDAPSGATIDTNGVISWTPTEAQGPGTNVFTTVASDGGGLSATNSFTVVVTEVNVAPGLPFQSDMMVAEHTLLIVTNSATDADEPANLLTYTLLQPPGGAEVDTNGVITWTPEEAQGPGTNVITTIVTDGGGLGATNSFTVVVTEVNAAPTLPVQNQQTIAELSVLTVTNTATDSDLPANLLSYLLLVAPTNAVISTNGVITWAPNEAEGPGTNTFTAVVTDSGGLSATNSFIVVVTEVNAPPSLPAQTQKTIAELATLIVTNSATDSDLPANVLAYTLSVAPTNAVISTNGIITWTPNEAQGPATNTFTTIVTDGGLSATNTFTVVVTEVNLAPVASNDTYAATGPLSINAPGILANDTDADLPPNTLTAVFVSGPTNGNLNLTNNGGFAYTPNPEFSGADTFTYLVNDGTSISAPATVTLTVTSAPYITGQPNSQSVVVGTNASFFVAAAGTGPLSYQWRKGGSNILGATSSQLSLVNVQTNDAGSYQAVITNVVGAVTSSVATLTVNAFGNCLAAPSGMLGWWAGDGNPNDIYSTQHGTLVGGATATGVGKVAQAFTFDGTNNYVSIPDSPSLRPTNYTIEAWVKFDNLNSAGSATVGQQYIVFKQNTRSSQFEGFFLGKERSGGNDTFAFAVTAANGTSASVNSTTLIATGVWYHVAAVRSATTIQLYVNGAMQAQATANFAQDYGNFPLFFGTSGQPSWDRKFKGVLDEVTIYNRPLASNEIVAIYAANAGGKCKGPSAPSIITQPSNKTYVAGGGTSFSVVAAGSAPLSYQWFRDGFIVVNDARISGANSAVLSITAMQPSDIANYNVTVSNSLGTATSATASLNTGSPPPNDNFAAAYSISGSSGSTNGNNANATRQSGEPDHAGNAGPSSVWYNWTAPSASPVTFDTSLSSFDTLLGVYTGNNVNNLTLVATNNNVSTNNSRSRVTFTPVSGTVYRIAVDGDDGANGNLTLRWVQASVALPDLVIFNSAVNPHVTTETFSANSCAVMEGLVPAGTRRLIRFDTQTANQGNADLIFGNPAVNPAFVYAPCHAHYHFQNYMSYRLRQANGELAATGLKVGFCVLDVFRWDNGAPGNAKYNCNNQGIQKGWGDLYDSTLDGQWIDITGLPDGNYFIEMEVNPVGMILESNYGNNITTIPVTVGNSSAPPLNNNFGSAQTLLGTSPSVAGANLNATKESGEPNHAGNAGGKSIWYNWTAPSTKAVTIDTINSGFNTLLGVYTGNAVNSLTLVTNNDDIIPGSVLQSRVTFNATGGTLYRIAVDGFNGASSNVIITVNQTVANDAYNACIFVGGVFGSISGSTGGATKEVGEPNHAGNAGGSSTWYCWTAPVGGTVTFDTEGSPFNTLLGVYTGSSVSALTFIAGNDDDGTNQHSRVSFNAVGLTMYHIVIDGFNGDSGNTMLNWSLSAAAPSSALLASLGGGSNAGQMPTDGRAKLSFNLLAEGMCQVAITGQPQQRYRIERSCDLRTWVPLVTTVADFNGRAYFTDKAARHLKTGSGDVVCGSGQILGVAVSPTEARFYRAVAVP